MNKATTGHLVKILENASADPKHADFAEAKKYLDAFRHMEGKFFDGIHSDTDTGLAMAETAANEGGSPNIFTRHNGNHIVDLSKNLDKLAESIERRKNGTALSVLEAYILLCSAHVHDAANVSGRKDHPQRVGDFMAYPLRKPLFTGTVEMEHIRDVASAHGGEHEEFGKDTFRAIEANNYTHPRLHLLAALLRIADELAENPGRVPEYLLEHYQASEHSQLAHAYARSFANFELRDECLKLVYRCYPGICDGENESVSSFIQFLEKKLNAIESEARYCSQYGRPYLSISEIDVAIQPWSQAPPGGQKLPLRQFKLNLLNGYPENKNSLCERSVELKEAGFKCLDDAFVGLYNTSSSIRKSGKATGTEQSTEPSRLAKFLNKLFFLGGNS
ncbi:MAG: hypothetical protein J0L72_07490 [Armatimonadetes bacterium]|nr:hypothetical protein [Armatimonadota bacterium]